jgi:hypothetical protein
MVTVIVILSGIRTDHIQAMKHDSFISRWAGCLSCALNPGVAGVEVPGELGQSRGRAHTIC